MGKRQLWWSLVLPLALMVLLSACTKKRLTGEEGTSGSIATQGTPTTPVKGGFR
ncbi:MAG: hypothetical protein HYY44_06935 [Deltaproteobacteria bacterium]|nr:hypothetical protein [Deltaproteobacteria bacterium]